MIDGNGNLISQTDEDGYVTTYAYNAADLVTAINGYVGDQFSNNAAHEFGHVLGLWDAYGYAEHWKPLGYVLPAAPADKASKNNVMRNPWWEQNDFEPIVYEMMLYAWSTDSLQVFSGNILGPTSNAFYS